MSSGTQVELDWTEVDAAPGGASTPLANGAGSGTGAYLTDEEILGLEPVGAASKAQDRVAPQDDKAESVGARHAVPLQPEAQGAPGMPQWMVAAAGDPKHGAEAQRLGQEHQASQAVDQLDAAIYSGDARAQSEVVAELARANPAAFRQLFAEAEKVLAGMGQAQPVSNQTPTLRETREGWGTQPNPGASQDPSMAGRPSPVADHPSSRAAELRASESPVTDHPSAPL